MKKFLLLAVAFVLGDCLPAAAQGAVTVYPSVQTVPVIETYGWYSASRRRAGGWVFQSAYSYCIDYDRFVSNAAEQCMLRHGYIYAPVRPARFTVGRNVVRVRG
jgi:hypothetical protein